MVSLEQEESVDPPELRENSAHLDLLDPLDSLDLLLVPFTLDTHTRIATFNLTGTGLIYQHRKQDFY